MTIMDPYDSVLIHVIYYCDVPVALSVSGLIYTDTVNIIVDPKRDVRLKACMRGFDTVTDCPPVDAKVFADGSFVHLTNKPCYLIIEGSGESAGSVSPWNELVKGAMLRA